MIHDEDFVFALIEKFGIRSFDIDQERFNDKRYVVKKLFDYYASPDKLGDSDSTHCRVEGISYLEELLNTDFFNTHEFREKIKNYLQGYDLRMRPIKDRIKKARKKAKLTQKGLATLLGYKTHVSIANFEDGKRHPSKRVLEWLKEQGM